MSRALVAANILQIYRDAFSGLPRTIWLLGFVAFAAYLAARSRGSSTLRTLGYVLVILFLAGLVSIIKYILTH